ncbi:DNA-methyltransferase [Rubinisphaera margarita]|uniref:DNA-methyltransferase n=1 Tax=Rubinisphaera margarita TaxID=2909586 RepID=UPI001EE7A612|nr:site-specific DNA-methyltransferase [Rubinisphaera margarita]MCG6154998.1 site-specific DNA-methyltransferase [Rubinisphaera margarita]
MKTEQTVHNTILKQDCVAGMAALEPGSVDLVFADPPFNIGYEYDQYEDSLERNQYLEWSREWISGVYNVLKSDGTFWLAIGDEYAAELKLMAQEIGFHCRSWVIWYYTFGVNCKQKFSRSHAHLFYFVKDPSQFTFRGDELENRIPSARQLVYNDKRANPTGRLPDDTWIIRPAGVAGEFQPDDNRTWTLRPQDLEACFSSTEDTWYFPRVAGTFKERAGFHGCQMPEQLLGRIIRYCSREDELVLDPFAGSATTLAAAKKLGRNYLGFELSDDYVERGTTRLEQICRGDALDGSAEPTMSAPGTWAKKTARKTRNTEQVESAEPDSAQLQLTYHGIRNAFGQSHDGYSIDRVLLDPKLTKAFHKACRQHNVIGDPLTWNLLLLQLRQNGQLADLPATRQTDFSWTAADPYLAASEMALQSLLRETASTHLEEIFCDPDLATQFDERAKALTPGFKPFQYRWAALMISRQLLAVTERAGILKVAHKGRLGKSLRSIVPLKSVTTLALPDDAAVYTLACSGKTVYAGETLSLRERVGRLVTESFAELTGIAVDQLQLRYRIQEPELFGQLAWQRLLAEESESLLNLQTN